MKLTITLLELASGSSLQKGSKERITELAHMAGQKEPVAIYPVVTNNHKVVAAVLLLGATPEGDRGTSIRLTIRPFWCKLFRLCSMKKDELTALVMEVDDGKKYWIDHNEVKECDFTTEGLGTDPQVIAHSQLLFGEMLAEDNYNHIFRSAVGFVQGRF